MAFCVTLLQREEAASTRLREEHKKRFKHALKGVLSKALDKTQGDKSGAGVFCEPCDW